MKRSHFLLKVLLYFLAAGLFIVFYLGNTCTAGNTRNFYTLFREYFSVKGRPDPLCTEQKNGVPSSNGAAEPAGPSIAAGRGQEGAAKDGSPEQTPETPPGILQPAGHLENGINNDGNKGALPQQYDRDEYDYSKPVPAMDVAVAEEYFQDAVFIGDSRTDGFRLFSGPPAATYYTANGLKVDTIFTKEVVETGDGEKITIIAALQQKPFQKVYIMLGINELGWAYSSLFIQKYGEVITTIKNNLPQARIYIQSLLPVSKQRSLSDKVYNNARISEYNELIKQMAAEKKVYYLDVAQGVADAEGNLAGDASADGIHLQKEYCDRWLDYLQWHYVVQ